MLALTVAAVFLAEQNYQAAYELRQSDSGSNLAIF